MRSPIDPGLGAALGRARRVVVFTGAGVSAESGIPTFRDALTGLWARFDPVELASEQAFHDDPALVWGWYEWRRAAVLAAEPNPAHHAVAALRRSVPEVVVVTQNVDDLHERAGCSPVLHLHGSLFAPRCSACTHPAAPPESHPTHRLEPGQESTPTHRPEPGQGPTPPRPAHAVSVGDGDRIDPPACDRCGQPVRPGVVWFGESLPADVLAEAGAAACGCDVLLAVGTSGVVYPAARLPVEAARAGATVIQINPEPTPLDQVAEYNLRGSAGTVLPALVASVWPPPPAPGR